MAPVGKWATHNWVQDGAKCFHCNALYQQRVRHPLCVTLMHICHLMLHAPQFIVAICSHGVVCIPPHNAKMQTFAWAAKFFRTLSSARFHPFAGEEGCSEEQAGVAACDIQIRKQDGFAWVQCTQFRECAAIHIFQEAWVNGVTVAWEALLLDGNHSPPLRQRPTIYRDIGVQDNTML